MTNDLPTHYVNSFSTINGPDEIFLTLGLAVPNEKIMQPLFQCALSGDCIAKLIDALQVVYQKHVQLKASEEMYTK